MQILFMTIDQQFAHIFVLFLSYLPILVIKTFLRAFVGKDTYTRRNVLVLPLLHITCMYCKSSQVCLSSKDL